MSIKKGVILISSLTMVFMVGQAAYADLNDGLVPYYPFNGNDESGYEVRIYNRAYQINWWSVQHRIYEDGRDLNQLWFEVTEEWGYYPTEDVVKSVKLFDPNGNEVTFSNLRFYQEDGIFGEYNNGWRYDESPSFGSYYKAEFESALIAGTYRLQVTDVNDNTSESEYVFNKQVNLPIISSSSFNPYLTPANELIWEYEIPVNLSPDLDTSVAGCIEIYNNDNYVGYIWIRLPTDLGYIYVPEGLVEYIENSGTRFELIIMLRTNDNNNRAYSNPLKLTIKDLSVSERDSNEEGNCFIAKAAYSSPMEPQVKVLHEFRDRFLLNNTVGKGLVDFYYTNSPPIADFIANHDSLRTIVRVSLLPVVGLSWVALKIGPVYSLALMFLLCSGLVALVCFRNKLKK
jgi:hypothetical protein